MGRKALKMMLSATVLGSAGFMLACGGGGGGGGGNANIAGVWSGSYTDSSGTTIPVCLELKQSDSKVSGTAYVGGAIYNVSINGTVSGNSFQVTISGKGISNQQVTIKFSGNVTSNSISGTATVTSGSTSQTYSLSLSKKNTKSCGWASQNVVGWFGALLSYATNYAVRDPDAGYALASAITSLPTVDVVVNGGQPENWFVCIWEVRDKRTTPYSEYTVGAIINPNSSTQPEGTLFYAKVIGINQSGNAVPVSSSLNLTQGEVAYYFQSFTNTNPPSSYYFLSDGTNDTYTNNNGTTLSSQNPYYVSPCMNGVRYKAWMGQLSFSLVFDGNAVGSGPNPGSFTAPPSGTKTIPSVYIEVTNCP